MEKGKKQVVIFDLDGTILDSIKDISKGCNAALVEHHLPTHTMEDYKKYVGWGAKELIRRAVLPYEKESLQQRVFDTYNEKYSDICKNKGSVFPEIPELLTAIREKGAMVAVLTNKPHNQTELICNSTFVGLLDYYLGQSEQVSPKPDLGGYYKILEALDGECVAYIGDSDVDMCTGKAAKVPTFGVAWGIPPVEKMEAVGYGKIVDTVKELQKEILQIIK